MNKLVAAFTVAFVLLSVFCAFMEGGGGIQATTLAAPIASNTTTSMQVASTTGFMPAGILFVQNEKISYTSTNATYFITLQRGYDDTTASAYINGTTIYSEPAGVMNQALGFDIAVIATSNKLYTVPQIAWNFFAITMPKLVLWNFSFFQGDLIIVRYVLMALSIGFYITFAIQIGQVVASALAKVI